MDNSDKRKQYLAQRKVYREVNKAKIKEEKRLYYLANKESLKEKHNDWLANNKDKVKTTSKEWRKNNKNKVKSTIKNWQINNKDKVKKSRNKYRTNNKDKANAYKKEYRKSDKQKAKELEYRENNKSNRKLYDKNYRLVNKNKINNRIKHKIATNPVFKLRSAIHTLVKNSFKYNGYKKQSSTEQILGCSYEFLKQYLEQKFEPWMSWDNKGKYDGTLNFGWDIDHIIPLASATCKEDVIRLNHYTNLQPLCGYTNRHIKRNLLRPVCG